ncbi:integral membrane sensor signal transduction histidine kinase [Roseibium sp. TrichSKD4]|uniref:ATP-binding protein n=1 Tax=Roseibium sp. TrichSKD4 TaxID=744980 RepID=UPI0001E57158|nr:ATP-binding protein [Roseibium sp. TrichSKD4]EFO28964.1 integral membrane sensor signal transduction histidine kinase [Roseibium sp. TrichSKD4]
MNRSVFSRFNFKRLVPQSLATQLIALLLTAVLLSQVVGIWIFHDERRVALIQLARDNLLQRSVEVAKLLDDTPPILHGRILEASSSRFTKFWYSETPLLTFGGGSRMEQHIQEELSEEFADGRAVLLQMREPPRRGERRLFKQPPRDEQADNRKKRHPDRLIGRKVDLELTIPLNNGRFLNLATSYRPPPWAILPLLFQLGFLTVLIVLIVFFAVRRIARPLKNLAEAAGQLGRGEDVPPLKEMGPREVRSVTSAFNDMQARLTRFVSDRTRMLAAISHDLRTPITSLRLRAEFIEDDENREKIIQTLDEMAAMTEATLTFAKEEARKEEGTTIDLADLLAELAADQVVLGHDVTFAEVAPVLAPCRPMALKRALRNLVENGVRYGDRVKITLASDQGEAVITIRDEGPGIPEHRLADVFEPFVRLDDSRNEETGGIGLGLSIARSIIHAQGGSLSLQNVPEGGLVAMVRLPLG